MINDEKPIRSMTNVNYYPPSELINMNINMAETKRFPIENVASLGVVFKPLMQLASFALGKAGKATSGNVAEASATAGVGKSGLYFVETFGKTMFESRKKDGSFIGSLMDDDGRVGGGAASMTPVSPDSSKTQIPLDPTMLFMAVALFSIEKKLESIKEAQTEILAFLEMKEEAKLKGNLNALAEVLNNYKFNWDNEKYKSNKHVLVQDIKREAEQSLILFREQLGKILGKKTLISSGKDVKSMLSKTKARLNDYQLALYTFSFSSFIEVMLLENFDTNYLGSIEGKIVEYAADYKCMYERCAERFEKDSKTSLEGFALKGLSKISHGAGKLVEKIPLINNSPLDANLTKAGDALQNANTNRTQNILNVLADGQIDCISSFVENIRTLDTLYNQQVQLMFDSENIYIGGGLSA